MKLLKDFDIRKIISSKDFDIRKMISSKEHNHFSIGNLNSYARNSVYSGLSVGRAVHFVSIISSNLLLNNVRRQWKWI